MSDTAIRIDRSYNEKTPLIQSSTLNNAPQVNLDVDDLQKTPLYYQSMCAILGNIFSIFK